MSYKGTDGPAARYVEAMLRMVDGIEGQMDGIVEIAEDAADRVVSGGKLYAAEDGASFVSEGCGRAGGMMMIAGAPEPSGIEEGDVVIAGTLDRKVAEQAEQLGAFRERGARVILCGSSESALKGQVDHVVATGLPAGTAPLVNGLCPGGATSNITAFWALTAELIGACTRRGKMPTMWQSVGLPGSKERNPKYLGKPFHGDEFRVPPLMPGGVARTFLSAIRRSFVGIQGTQLGLFEEAGAMGAKALRGGGKVWCNAIGHHMGDQMGQTGDPGVLTTVTPEVGNELSKEDAYMMVGYYHTPEGELAMVRAAGIPSLWINGGRELVPIEPQPGEIHIDPYWEYGDSVVMMPGYDIRTLPPSGIVQTATWWMVAGEIAQAMA